VTESATTPEGITLLEARAWLRERLAGGETCPCCDQRAKVYERPLTSVAARAVIALWRTHRTRFGHMPTVAQHHLADVQSQGGYLVLGAHWGLIQSESAALTGGGRAGFWRVTNFGEAWIHGRTAVPAKAVLYNGACRELVGRPVTVFDVLGTRFDLARLLGASRPASAGADDLRLFPPSEVAGGALADAA
jgi:hypothetical protein